MIVIKSGVTSPNGFLASGIKAGIKRSGRADLALLYSEVPAVAAAAFTTNRFQASPVKVSKDHIKAKKHQAIIVNSGNANCANGSIGDKDALKMTEFIGNALFLDKREVLVASTGIIGAYLPLAKIEKAIPELAGELSGDHGTSFAEAIMTTDTVKKELAVKVKLGKATVTIGGACKGVGMIYPLMKTERHATMLCFLTTDAAITKKMLAASLDEAIGDSFNMISVDGDMSTNDSCFIMANGLAKNREINSRGSDYGKFTESLKFVMSELSKKLVRDGEGATKFVEILVTGAKSESDAKAIARKISTSNLLKCAVCGEDPNWGRIVAAAGSSGVNFDPDKVDVYLGNLKALSDGASVKGLDKNRAHKLFTKRDVHIKVDLKSGSHEATAWTCDFSKEYVAINSEYST
ncbi:MAG: bifunctional glutamate N-acetyltransferase/amino-acid acetyltransferase ArgJ [Candidatus Omnitrophota bacterium]|jgi:glutamate N-acetyltransferase/amino-acid N-acetyltransferase|nr:bifunctional glutamate N-acetyltransferase/amino-acid acetyltransferase ArgJ [Candidatus Omnitrophota bacterium]